MPFAVDEERMVTQTALDMSRPPNTPQGLPLKNIPFNEFPRVLYKHPVKPFKKVEHRNTKHEVVHTEYEATEHLTCAVHNREEMARKLKEGWVKEPYIQQAPPDPDAALYEANAGGSGAAA